MTQPTDEIKQTAADLHDHLTDAQRLLLPSVQDILLDSLQGVFIDPVEQEVYPIFSISRHDTLLLLTWLKLGNSFGVDTPLDCFATDTIQELFRFTVSYVLQSSWQNYGLKVVTKASETKPVLSTQGIFPARNWAERERWDMSGVFSVKHPDLRRILTDYGFVGYPLQKDFPLSGFRELLYDYSSMRVGYVPLELTQTMRNVTVTSPTIWAQHNRQYA